ncbi:hypothetical protein BD310DRAFT_919921 [Dichomitus squalens]|uniref:Uncharacterized protein n=1 Tax=Dichomitus squalens TaxID=114155 RepID=A0A4Q9Q3R9_9APHY|nr:hypothetical protein BD310DRAFT_919921 [Dichomitus squalens]
MRLLFMDCCTFVQQRLELQVSRTLNPRRTTSRPSPAAGGSAQLTVSVCSPLAAAFTCCGVRATVLWRNCGPEGGRTCLLGRTRGACRLPRPMLFSAGVSRRRVLSALVRRVLLPSPFTDVLFVAVTTLQ